MHTCKKKVLCIGLQSECFDCVTHTVPFESIPSMLIFFGIPKYATLSVFDCSSL